MDYVSTLLTRYYNKLCLQHLNISHAFMQVCSKIMLKAKILSYSLLGPHASQ
jgi:hypothetical protein